MGTRFHYGVKIEGAAFQVLFCVLFKGLGEKWEIRYLIWSNGLRSHVGGGFVCLLSVFIVSVILLP